VIRALGAHGQEPTSLAIEIDQVASASTKV
jgi:hypothetical protein